MLKVVVFDGGFGGELFADLLEQEIPILEVIRVIDWRNASALNQTAKSARIAAEKALSPYFGKVELIILANHLLSMTSLKYFQKHYPDQKFLGLHLELPPRKRRQNYLVLTTGALARTLSYWSRICRLGINTKTLRLDTWPAQIDDGELNAEAIAAVFQKAAIARRPARDIILGCTTFRDIEHELKHYFHGRIKVYDGFDIALRSTCKILGIRGGLGKKRKPNR